jgi:tRNA(Leu) C34 or U34 (ribose-2'-O)-methylase TrmL
MKPEPLPPTRGYFGIGIENGKFFPNIGTLLRSAHSFGANFVFLIGNRIAMHKLRGNTSHTEKQIPLHYYATIEDFAKHIPYGCTVVGIETGETSRSIFSFEHPDRVIYLLGAEDSGISVEGLNLCSSLIKVPTQICLNVATTGSVIMYDRMYKNHTRKLP